MPTVLTNDIETHYVTQGAGPPIVFVHGMALSAAMWADQMAALSDTFTTVAYDVRGHGHTGGSDRSSYSIALFAADLEALLDALDLDRVALCGLSMGGAIVQAFAAAHPDRVAGLVLADTFAPGPVSLSGRLALWNVRFLARLERFVDYRTLNRLQMRVGQWLVPGMAGDRTSVQRLLEDGPTIPHEEFVKIADATARFPKSALDLSVVTAPALVLRGEHLPSGLAAAALQVAIQLTNATPEVRVVPGAGHASNLDNPVFVTDAVRTFLTDRVYRESVDDDGP